MDLKVMAKSVNDTIGNYRWIALAGTVILGGLAKLLLGRRHR